MKTVNKKGFTLIEVVLVLAIGGLIFLLAFLAFQQVQRNRRDTQRRSDAGRMAALFNDLKADAGGNTAPTHDDWRDAILAAPNMTPPDASAYTFAAADTDYASAQPSTLGSNAVRLVNASNDYSVCVGLEGGVVCRDVE